MPESRRNDIKVYCETIGEALKALPRANLKRRKELSQRLWFKNRILGDKPLTAKQSAQVLEALTKAILFGAWANRD